METALEIIARIGTDNPPTVEELASARDTIARELHALKGSSSVDLEAVASLRETYTVVTTAITETETALSAEAEQVDDLLDGIPDPDAAIEPDPGAEVASITPTVLPLREAVARLGLGAPAAQVTEPDPTDGLADVTHRVRLGTEERDDVTWRDMAEAFKEAGGSLKQGKERVVRITSEYDNRRTLPGTVDGNTRLVDSFISPEAVAAAGGCCSLPTPIYENPVDGSTARPIRDSLTAFGADRGEVSFFPAVCIPQAGAAVWTCEEDAAVDPEDPDTWKTCAEVECDESETAGVEAIYKCITIGNYQSRFSPEQWQARLQALAISHARLAEVNLFGNKRAGVTSTHTGISTGSTYANVINSVGRAAALIRQDQRLESVDLDLWIGDWIKTAIREDMRNRGINTGRADVEVIESALAAAFASEGVSVHYSLDIDDLESFQYDGDLADYPTTASAVLAPNGFFTYLDGGQFDLGTEIRDHDLNRQNKVAAFAESFEGLLARGCNAKALDIPVEVCEVVPCPEAA